MDLLTVLRILLRRWMILLPALLLTGVTAFLLSSVESATYQAYGSVLLTTGPATQQDGIAAPDPDALLRPTAAQLAPVLQDATPDLPPPRQLVPFNVDVDPQFPVLTVSASAEDPDDVLATVLGVAALGPAELRRLQLSGSLDDSRSLGVRQLLTPSEALPTDGDGFTASVTLLVDTGGVGDEGSGLGGDVAFVGEVLRERLRDDVVRAELVAAGATEEVTVGAATEGSRLMQVIAQGEDAEATIVSGQRTIEKLQELLQEVNDDAGIPEPFRPQFEVLAFPLEAEVIESNTLRIVMAVVALGVLASIGLALMFDAALSNRRRASDLVSGATMPDTEVSLPPPVGSSSVSSGRSGT